MTPPFLSLSRRTLRVMVIYTLSCVMLVTAWPSGTIRALVDETGTDQIIDNSQADFASGVFQRTVVAAAPSTPSAPDVVGAVELAPVGALNRNNWSTSSTTLPLPLSDAPVVSLSKYLFVIGGATTIDSNGESVSNSNYVFRGEINQATGAFVTDSYPAPGNDAFKAFPIQGADPGPECDIVIAGRSRSAAVAVPATTGSNLGYIFIVGGNMYDQTCATYNFSTNLVQRATVNANGDIIAWNTPDTWRFPTLDSNGEIITNPASSELRGVQDLQLVHVRTSAGNDFIYAIGGLSVAPSQLLQQDIYPYVFYTKVDANGNLTHPTNSSAGTVWAKLADLPFPLHSGTALAVNTTRIEGGAPVQKDAIFLLGGCTTIDCTLLNTSVWRADVNPTTGTLTWTDQVAAIGSGTQAINIQARHNVTGLSFNNRIYYITGSTANSFPGASGATATIPVAIFNDQFLLEDLTNSNIYFVGTNETNDRVLPEPYRRVGAAAALIPAVPPDNVTSQVYAAWMYVIGGASENNEPTNTIFFGGVGSANETTSATRAPEGWYYSQPFPVLTDNETSRLLALKWFVDLNRPSSNPEADIRIQFRAAVTSGTCRESDFDPSPSISNPERWRAIDANPDPVLYSKDGLNQVRLINAFPDEEIQATCMQYRAQLIQDPGDRTFSPKLLYFAVEKIVAAKPDIIIETFDVQTNNGSFRNIVLTLRNLRKNSLAATRSVVAASGGGGFFVDLCIARRTDPDVPVLTSVPAPDPNAGGSATPACVTVSAQVPKEPFIPGASYTVPLNSWNKANGEPANWNTIFGTPGTYDIGIVVDYNTMTGEDAEGRSNNRGESPSAPNGIIRTITVVALPTPEPESIKVFVPVIYR
ncbi:hypothetical protein [Chloroflexus sp.]|uniref:hypothetical protein n=1 Tax=Chloroflexus sp. TaxID=1904827 RepID=UPI003C77AE35